MDYLPYIKLHSYCFCYCIVCQLLMVLLHCSLNIPADAVGGMSKLENLSFNTNNFHHILRPLSNILGFVFHDFFSSLSLSHPFCVVCMFTHMIRFRRKCLVIVLLNKHVLQSRSHVRCCFRRTGQALTICITTLFSSRLRVNYDYITNLFKRCKPLCLGSLSYLLSSLLRFNLIFGYFFF